MVRNYKDGKKIDDHIYDDWGYLNCIHEYDLLDDSVNRAKYYTTAGKLCLEAFYDHADIENDEPEKILVYDEQGKTVKECANRSELAAMCLEQIMPKEKLNIIVIEDGLLSETATLIDKTKFNLALCEVVHAVYQKDPYNPNSEPQKYYEHMCNNHAMFDGIIMLTEEAKKDFQNQYGKSNNIYVIPHFYPYEIRKVDFDSRDHKKAVIVARLDPLKQLEHAIYIFSLVVKDVPDAKLEIYGRGEEEDMLSGLIDKLRLKNNVFLMGLTDDPVSVMNSGALFIMTSLAEGYGMALIESISNGCPVFSFDIKYGPSEIVTEGRTGFLFHRSDKEGFAKKIIAFLKDPDMQRTMSKYCYADAPRFSSGLFLDRWYDMTATLYDHR